MTPLQEAIASGEPVLNRAATEWELVVGPKMPYASCFLSLVADAKAKLGGLDKAEALCRRAIEGLEESYGICTTRILRSVATTWREFSTDGENPTPHSRS